MRVAGDIEIILRKDLWDLGVGAIVREYVFHEERRWRFDWAIPAVHLACEVEGGIWSNGRHIRGKGYQNDLEKYNSAIVLGWNVFRFSTEDVLQGRARKFLLEWREHLG